MEDGNHRYTSSYSMLIAIILVLILIILWYTGYIWSAQESYRSCNDCINVMPRDGILAVNPYIWPYSGTSCINDLYILNKDIGTGLGFGSAPLTHLNTPDHVELIN